jgi:nicotinamide riboside kinase
MILLKNIVLVAIISRLINKFGGHNMTTRIAILGGPRCGKTTLMQQLYVDMKIAGLDVGCASEYSTDYLREKGMIETISEQYGIYLGQLKLEEDLSSFDYAITDYATFVPYIYARFMLGNRKRSIKEIEILKDLYGLAIRDISKYDYIFYVGREFGYAQDGVRWQDEETAQAIDTAILQFLDNESVPHMKLTGNTKERAKQILETIDSNSDIHSSHN